MCRQTHKYVVKNEKNVLITVKKKEKKNLAVGTKIIRTEKNE